MMTKEDAFERLRLAYACPDVALTETIELIQKDAYRQGLTPKPSFRKFTIHSIIAKVIMA